MTDGVTSSEDVAAAVADAHRREWAFVLAATARVAGSIDLAEECVQDAYGAALDAWLRDGVPRSPGAWLTTTARRRALDVLRREQTLRRKLPLLVDPLGDEEPAMAGEPIPDDRLRLVFTCCHPALAREAQVALTLRLVCGLTTSEIARAFLVSEATMAARVTRAKKKISAARIPYRVPGPAELPERLDAVLTVVHLLFTTGHTAPVGADLLRQDLVARAMDLGRMLRLLMPDEPEVRGLLALMLLTDSRREARVAADGSLVLLEDQDRSRWDRDAIAEGAALADEVRRGRPGRFGLQAAIAAEHATAPSYEDTDWPRLLSLYDALLAAWPTPVVALNRTVPLLMVSGPAAALAEVEALEADGRLAGYRYLAATKADLLRRLARRDEAAAAYRRAIDQADNGAERAFLQERLAALLPRVPTVALHRTEPTIRAAADLAGLLPRCPVGERWEPVLVGESAAPVFRRSDGTVFAKCADRHGVRGLRDERDRVSWLSATDVPCAEVADWSESPDGACLVTTAIEGTRASDVPATAVPQVLASLAGVLRDLHDIPVVRCPFDRRLSATVPVVEDVVRRGAVDVQNLDPADRETAPSDLLAELRAQLDRMAGLEPADLVVCHGDACLPNVLLDPETWECVGVVDLGRLGVADRYLDLALLAANVGSAGMFAQFSAADADTLLRDYGLESADRARLRFYQVLDALSWG